MSALDVVVQILSWVLRRPSLEVRISADDPDQQIGGLRFEVENTRPASTSLCPEIRTTFTAGSGNRFRRQSITFDVRESDRELAPFKARVFSASARQLPGAYGRAWFRVYRFTPRRGVTKRVRVRNIQLEPLGAVRFFLELWRYRLCGRVRGSGSTSLSQFEARKRSQGPH